MITKRIVQPLQVMYSLILPATQRKIALFNMQCIHKFRIESRLERNFYFRLVEVFLLLEMCLRRFAHGPCHCLYFTGKKTKIQLKERETSETTKLCILIAFMYFIATMDTLCAHRKSRQHFMFC